MVRWPLLAQEVNAERVVILGWGRAILFQLAHPLVAAGVAEHSRFAADPKRALDRLHGTVSAMLAFTFGPQEAAVETAWRIARVHVRVRGALAEPVGPYSVGTPYSANDPALLAWVHATLVDSTLLAYERFVRPLTPAERDRYCVESRGMEGWLGLEPGTLPGSWGELQETLEVVRRSGQIAVGETARWLARRLLWPVLPAWLRPAARLWRLASIGLLPADLRGAYGLRWSARDQLVLDGLTRLVRGTLPWWPPALRFWPEARAAVRSWPQPRFSRLAGKRH
jgi:uncharacterized protein (DUF2236 family)